MFKHILNVLMSLLIVPLWFYCQFLALTPWFFTLLCSLVAFQRPRGIGSHSALDEENPAEENVYVMD